MLRRAPSFSSYAARYGGALEIRAHRASLDTYLDEVENAIDHIDSVCRATELKNARGERFRSIAGVTLEMDADAFADFSNGHHYIGMTLGQIASAMYISNEVVLKTRCLLEFGTVPANDREPFELYSEASFWDANRDFVERQGSSLSRADPRRKHVCYYLRWSMIMFALHHELAHASLGHCRALKPHGGDTRLRETGGSARHLARSDLHHIMEYDADRAATQMMMRLITTDSDWANVFLDSRFETVDRVRLNLLASALLTMSWFVSEHRSGAPDGMHPRPNLRFLNICSTVRQHLASMGADSVYVEALRKASYDLAYITHRSADLASAIKSFSLDAKTARRGAQDWSRELGLDTAEEAAIAREVYLPS